MLSLCFFFCALQFLWPLQRFSNSRVQHVLLNKGIDIEDLLERYEQDEPVHTPQLDSFKHLATITTTTRTTSTTNLPATTSKIRIKFTDANRAEHQEHKEKEQSSGRTNKGDFEATNITYEWQVGKWSICAPKCSNLPGKMQREVYCLRHDQKGHLNASVQVQRSQCENYSTAVEPVASQQCGGRECAIWQTSSWTPCQHSRCLGRHIAVQKRDVRCQFASNGSDSLDCVPIKKPITRKECYNPHCKGTWRVEAWSECNAPCGRTGIKYRVLQCVWYGTRRPAGNACRNQARPAVMKACKSPACNIALLTEKLEDDDCKDTSRYCRNVRAIGLCRLHRYQEKCCRSCKINIFN